MEQTTGSNTSVQRIASPVTPNPCCNVPRCVVTLTGSGGRDLQSGKGPGGPPAPVKALLSKFGSGKEEDRLAGYLKLLKVGPSLLKFVPGKKAKDLRSW